MSKKRIHEPLVIFGNSEDKPDLIGFMTYEDDLSQDLPRELHLDTQRRELSMLFTSGYEEILQKLDNTDIKDVQTMMENMKANKEDLIMGLYRHDKEGNMITPCYEVGVVLI